jgi:selenocysteine lyase/cysteine desulfurase
VGGLLRSQRRACLSPEHGGVRVSLAMFNTVGDIERLVEVIRTSLKAITLARRHRGRVIERA